MTVNNKHYTIIIEETVAQTFNVCAENVEEAENIAQIKYNNNEFVLEPGNLISKKMAIVDNSNDYQTEWFEF
jgi:hypothetical protein